MTCYVVDSSAFIDAAAEWYPRDVFPTIWEILEEFGQQGVVVSIDAVQDELLKRQDDLPSSCGEKMRCRCLQGRPLPLQCGDKGA